MILTNIYNICYNLFKFICLIKWQLLLFANLLKRQMTLTTNDPSNLVLLSLRSFVFLFVNGVTFKGFMLKKIFYFFISVFTVGMGDFTLSAEIRETNEISTIQDYVTSESLVLFNVTGTLYEPATTLANNQWRIFFAERAKAIASDQKAADRLVNQIKNLIVNHIPKKPVEEVTPRLIAHLQNQEIPVLGITQKQMTTSYADNFGFITSQHLVSIGVNLEETLAYLDLKPSSEDESHSLAYGLIFTNKKPIGPAILSFVNRLQDKPAKVIMIDNTRSSLEEAEAALLSTDVKFEGFRYGRADAVKTSFDPILGTIQFFAFIEEKKVLSDEEALQIKQADPEVDYVAQLDHFILEQLKLN